MDQTVKIRVGGRVQGVGFRPFVWRLARSLQVDGHVLNDNLGVLIVARASPDTIRTFIDLLTKEAPPLSAISGIECVQCDGIPPAGFSIRESEAGTAGTEISPDFATCAACRAETLDAAARRHGYAFTNCTHCGPRLSIVRQLPYDRAHTTMADFPLCQACSGEYTNPEDRRFHAEPIACPMCGPRLVLEPWARPAPHGVDTDPLQGAREALEAGEIIAIKALGGYQLACDATNAEAVMRLRAGKKRDGKPFALMARDVAAIAPFAVVDTCEAEALHSREAPIVLLTAHAGRTIAPEVAPGLTTLGFMLPSNPLQILLFEGLDRVLVMTSGNLSGDPQITDDDEARDKLGALAGYALTHNRAIANRIDDSVGRVMGGKFRLMRRARGFAPAALPLPPGLENAPDILAYGADLKASFCLVSQGQVVLSNHQGDLESAESIADFEHTLTLYRALYAHQPAHIVADLNEGYVSARLAQSAAKALGLPFGSVQHHHAHFAAVLGEHRIPAGGAALGIILDGLGLGDDGTLWGAEILLGSYSEARRIGRLKPSPLPGGDAASREPWRNLYAALATHIGWETARAQLKGSPLLAQLEAKPLALMERMIAGAMNSPLSSSCGRLFDAVAAALACGFERQRFEGEAAMQLETLCGGTASGEGYRFGFSHENGFTTLDPAPFWRAFLDDLAAKRDRGAMASDFHAGLMNALVEAVELSAAALPERPKIALGGGSFQNRLLLEGLHERLETRGFCVLSPAILPSNDGGIAFGQALVAAARSLPE